MSAAGAVFSMFYCKYALVEDIMLTGAVGDGKRRQRPEDEAVFC